MAPPRCRIGAITAEERQSIRARSPIGAKYDTPVNRESAYEILKRKAEEAGAAGDAAGGKASRGAKDAPAPGAETPGASTDVVHDWLWGTSRRQGMVEAMAKQAARTVGTQIGRQILRGVLGGIGRRR
jgi:hypothetical protein